MKKLLCLLTIAMVFVVGCTPDSDGFTYDSIFTIMTSQNNFLKSFSYSDILMKKLIVLL